MEIILLAGTPLFMAQSLILAGFTAQDDEAQNLSSAHVLLDHIKHVYNIPLIPTTEILQEGSPAYVAVSSMGGKGSTKNAKAIGGVINSSTDQMSLLLALEQHKRPLVAERCLCTPTASVTFLECTFTHAVRQDVETAALSRVDKHLRMAMVPFQFEPSLLTCEDALKAHGASHRTQEVLFLPIGPFAE